MAFFRTATLLGLLTGILLAVGYAIAGIAGMTLFLFISFLINFVSYWYSDKIVLGMYGAKEVSEESNPQLHQVVEKLAKEENIPKPRIYMVDSNIMNAFATGRSAKKGAVAVTSGLLRNLNGDEIEGVLSHELSHIKNRDTLTSTVAATVAGAIGYIAQIAWWSSFGGDRERSPLLLPLLIFAPFAAMLIQLGISRTREFKADYTGAVISKKPLSLASALQKISDNAKNNPIQGNAATSHLFIVNPFRSDAFIGLFSTHPKTEERIQRLRELAKKM